MQRALPRTSDSVKIRISGELWKWRGREAKSWRAFYLWSFTVFFICPRFFKNVGWNIFELRFRLSADLHDICWNSHWLKRLWKANRVANSPHIRILKKTQRQLSLQTNSIFHKIHPNLLLASKNERFWKSGSTQSSPSHHCSNNTRRRKLCNCHSLSI